MKKIYLFFMFTIISAMVVNAQSVQMQTNADKLNAQATKLQKGATADRMVDMQQRNTKGSETLWFYTPNAVDAQFGGDWDGYRFLVFPDTTMLRTWSDGTASATYMHSTAITFDPTSYIWDLDDDNWNENTVYTLDSIEFPLYYTRNLAGSAPDTLVLQISQDAYSFNLDASTSPWINTNFGVQAMSVPAVLHDELTWENTDAQVMIETIKIPLTQAIADDTNQFGRSLISYGLTTPIQFTEGAGFNISATFVPAYTWTANTDTIINFNECEFVTFEQNSAGFPIYTEDRNQSHIMNVQAYDDTLDTYYAHLFYSETLIYEYHDVAVKLTALNTGIESGADVLSVGQNVPNPFDAVTEIKYSLTQNSDVLVDVYNVAGAKVMSINEGSKAAGQHTMTINGSDLEAGVYYYTFTANGHSTTKKMIVY